MLGRKVTLQDMQSVDVELHNSVQYILENDPEPLCLTFAVNKTVFGQVGVPVVVGQSVVQEFGLFTYVQEVHLR